MRLRFGSNMDGLLGTWGGKPHLAHWFRSHLRTPMIPTILELFVQEMVAKVDALQNE